MPATSFHAKKEVEEKLQVKGSPANRVNRCGNYSITLGCNLQATY